MNTEELRFKCLEYAGRFDNGDKDEAIKIAKEFFNWVCGDHPGVSDSTDPNKYIYNRVKENADPPEPNEYPPGKMHKVEC